MGKKRPTPNLDRLRRRLRELTSEHGAKTRLAVKMLVTPQNLNDWLSGRYEPGGEVALQLLKWADAEEAKTQKQTKRPSRAATRLGPRPKARKHNEKKPNSGPP